MRRSGTATGAASLAIAALGLAGCAAAATAGQGTTSAATRSGTEAATQSRPGSPERSSGRAEWRVLGTFQVKGGASGLPGTRPLSGVVTFRDKAGQETDVTASPAGRFSGNLPAGTYTVMARADQIRRQNADGSVTDPPCTGPVTVIVRPSETTRVTLTCYVP
jgi:hypothetical protein